MRLAMSVKTKSVRSPAITDLVSQAFPGTTQCYGLISLTIGALGKYNKIFDEFSIIMDEAATFLGRLLKFLQNPSGGYFLEKQNRATVYDILQYFVLVLALSFSFVKKRNKVGLMLKVALFDEDAGVAEAHRQMKNKISAFTCEEIDQIMKSVSRMEGGVQQLNDKSDQTNAALARLEKSDRDNARKGKESEDLALIRDCFAITAETWSDKFHSLAPQVDPDTGGWLIQNDKRRNFAKWIDAEQPAPTNVFTLKGDSGFGKTFLCTHIIRHLQSRYQENNRGLKAMVAYYYFDTASKHGQSTDRAIKSILWQLASARALFAKALARKDLRTASSQDIGSLWEQMASDMRQHLDDPIFVILDGLDEDEARLDPQKPLTTIVRSQMPEREHVGSQFRFLLSGRQNGINAVKEDGCGDMAVVALGPAPIRHGTMASLASYGPYKIGPTLPNEEDLLQVTGKRLDAMRHLPWSSDKELQGLRMELPKRLVRGVQGNFVSLGFRLAEIEQCSSVEGIREILDRADEDVSKFLMRETANLNRSLDGRERDELNEILIWALGCIDPPSCEMLEAVLQLKCEKRVFVHKQILGPFRPLLTLDERDSVVLRSDDVESVVTGGSKQISKDVLAAEIAVIRKVVKTFCEEDLYDRFGFHDFFEDRVGTNAGRIHVSKAEVHVNILRICLQAIGQRREGSSHAQLQNYALDNFLWHLNQVSLSGTEATLKKEVGFQLVHLLREPELIRRWWSSNRIRRLARDFRPKGESLRLVRAWLTDKSVQDGLKTSPSVFHWIQRAVNEVKTVDDVENAGDSHLLSHILDTIVKIYLCDMETNTWTSTAFACIHRIYAQVCILSSRGFNHLAANQANQYAGALFRLSITSRKHA